jgi:hypothetical protein
VLALVIVGILATDIAAQTGFSFWAIPLSVVGAIWSYYRRRDANVSVKFCIAIGMKDGATGEPWKDSKFDKDGKLKNPRRSAGDIQITALPELKKARPWFAEIDSTVPCHKF